MAIADENFKRPTRRNFAAGLVALPMISSACASRPAASEGWPLWSVERNGRRAYLTGATPPREADWRQPRIEAIAAGCDLIWTETNQNSRGNMRETIGRLGVDASAPLSERIPESDWVRVQTAAAQYGVAIEDIDQFRPWLAAHMIGEASDDSRGWAGKTAESVIAAAALQAGKEVQSEFPFQEDVIEWFGALTAQQSLEFMRYTLDEVQEPINEENAKFDAWARGDIGPATEWMSRALASYPSLYEAIAIERNRDWVARFDAMLSQDRTGLVIVGLYHLVGPGSVQDNLSRMGFAVRRDVN
jgi:uncharacterized protein YbaP (TraB family)